jgi:hypothetical protein
VVSEWARFNQDALLLTNQRDLRFGDSDNSNWVAFQAPATVSSNVTWTLPATDSTGTQALVSNGSGTLEWGNMTTTATAVSATGTSVEFLSIPSWVNRIHFMFDGVSSSGSGSWLIQLGDSGGYETTGYVGAGSLLTSSVVTTGSTSGFILPSDTSSGIYSGVISISRLTGNTWTASGSIGNESGTDRLLITSGSKTLSDVLTQVRLVNVLGTDTFDAGTINISYNS